MFTEVSEAMYKNPPKNLTEVIMETLKLKERDINTTKLSDSELKKNNSKITTNKKQIKLYEKSPRKNNIEEELF
jgi:hypothetical protein